MYPLVIIAPSHWSRQGRFAAAQISGLTTFISCTDNIAHSIALRDLFVHKISFRSLIISKWSQLLPPEMARMNRAGGLNCPKSWLDYQPFVWLDLFFQTAFILAVLDLNVKSIILNSSHSQRPKSTPHITPLAHFNGSRNLRVIVFAQIGWSPKPPKPIVQKHNSSRRVATLIY